MCWGRSACGKALVDYVLTEAERRFLSELDARGVECMIVGLTAASLQGANMISGFGMMPPHLGGSLADRRHDDRASRA